MTIETYFTMNARIVAILRQGDDPILLYAAQRIEELEKIANARGECLEIAMKALKHYDQLGLAIPKKALAQINARLAELEPEGEG